MKKFILFFISGFIGCTSINSTDSINYIETPIENGIADSSKVEMAIYNGMHKSITVEHIGYITNFNTELNIPNFVTYELTNSEVNGLEERSDKFLPDPNIENCPVTVDYKGSGYDRGHMAPAADMKWSEQAMIESFYMSNMCPQIHSLNAGDWKDLEELIRSLANKFENLYITCGPIFYEKNYINYIYGPYHNIAIPEAFYKALLVYYNNEWHSIGFIMKNEAGSKPLMTYMCTVNDIEKQIDVDLFVNLSDSIEETVEDEFDISIWTVTKEKVNKQNNIENNCKQTYNGHTIFVGPKGGRYYINEKGAKIYIK